MEILCNFGYESFKRPARTLNFHMVINIPKRKGNSLGDSSCGKFVFLNPPNQSSLEQISCFSENYDTKLY